MIVFEGEEAESDDIVLASVFRANREGVTWLLVPENLKNQYENIQKRLNNRQIPVSFEVIGFAKGQLQRDSSSIYVGGLGLQPRNSQFIVPKGVSRVRYGINQEVPKEDVIPFDVFLPPAVRKNISNLGKLFHLILVNA